jgi:hypothetical protein
MRSIGGRERRLKEAVMRVLVEEGLWERVGAWWRENDGLERMEGGGWERGR